jgi:hypothetical protein
MSLIDRARIDTQRIITNNAEWGVEIHLEAPDMSTADVVGIHTKHHLGVDAEGMPVSSQNAHVSIIEQSLIEQYYPVRNADGRVAMMNHKVTVKDSTGIAKTYVVTSVFPDETLGLILCQLGNYKTTPNRS